MSLSGYYETSYPPNLWEPAPEPVPATGVVPGTPGTFTPIGCQVPANLAALQSLGALGETTAWTTGQYVVLGDASNAHWNGTAWVAGISATGVQGTSSPVDSPEGTQEATEPTEGTGTAPEPPEAPEAS